MVVCYDAVSQVGVTPSVENTTPIIMWRDSVCIATADSDSVQCVTPDPRGRQGPSRFIENVVSIVALITRHTNVTAEDNNVSDMVAL